MKDEATTQNIITQELPLLYQILSTCWYGNRQLNRFARICNGVSNTLSLSILYKFVLLLGLTWFLLKTRIG